MDLRKSAVCSAVVLALTSTHALADDNAISDVDETMVVHAQSFDDYKVDSSSSAMRMDMNMLETPQSVTVIPEIILDEQLATTLGEALRNDASISQGTKKWNREVFSLRGFELESGNGYLIDGHPQFAHYMLPIETVEQVEVLKGPSSLLYGQSGPGGLVNMVTKKPTAESRVNLGTDIDDEGSTRYHIDASGALNESGSVRGRTVMVKQDTEERRQYANGENRERDRFLGYGVIEADLSDWGLLSVHYQRTQDKANIDSGAWLDESGNDLLGRDNIWDMPWTFTENDVENMGANLSVYVNEDWTVRAGYNHQQMRRHRRDSSASPTDSTLVDGSYQISPFDRYDDWQYHSYFVDTVGYFNALGMEHQTLIGMSGIHQTYRQKIERTGRGDEITVTPGDPLPGFPDLDYNRFDATKSGDDFYGFYIQDLMTINDYWQVLVGGRFDMYRQDTTDSSGNNIDNDSNSFVPKVGVIYHPAHNGSIYVNYSEGFNPNSVKKEGQNTGQDTFVLDPEESRIYELGTKWELMDNSLLVTGAIFDIEKENVAYSYSDSSNDTIWGTVGAQRHRGAEAAVQGQVSDQLFMMATAMYLDAEYRKHSSGNNNYTGNRPANVPEWSGSAWARYAMTPELAFNLGMFYQGDRYADHANTLTLDAYTRVDVGASYKLKSGDITWDFRANVENLFDEDYFVGSGGSYSNGIIRDVHYGDERKFKFSVNASF
ncbi:TonB-dependent siderophore receptor [Photobacterium sanctipauli]|uniref:TonB-dependent siderophore receptor n=1 Tax=Photobacterium sanctipauli TaxID=1342794 RepID=A0A2T3NNV0_9GAMM|nr:TonB-dependent receptor [Photobacterium sanctipauli]PSW17639.1 TonB-dependent siderophore receptor [Photobacterium sanctipauli]